MVVSCLTVHIDQVLLTRGTSKRSKVLLTEHSIIFGWSTSLLGKKVHNFSYLFTQLSKSLHHIFFISKLIQDLLDHISKLVHDTVFKVKQVFLVSLSRHLGVKLVKVTVSIISMSFKFSP